MVEAEAKYIPHKIHVRDRLLPWMVLKVNSAVFQLHS